MKIKVSAAPKKDNPVDVNVVFCFKKSTKGGKTLVEADASPHVQTLISDSEKEGIFDASKEQTLFYRLNGDESKHTLTLGFGSANSVTPEVFRRVGALCYKELIRHKAKTARFKVKGLGTVWSKKADVAIQAFIEGLYLGSYKFDDYIAEKIVQTMETFEITYERATQKKSLEKAVHEAVAIAESINFARSLGDNPGNKINPVLLAEELQKSFKGTGVKVTVWDLARLKKEKMGLLIGVGQGSAVEPRFITLEYKGASKKPVCFVGKGITFDTGGISLKPGLQMEEMKYDMCGAANVAGTMMALAKTNSKVNAIAFISAAENMPGPHATKPGDVHTARSGTTVEVFNTDAEGRLVLADALTVACEHNPQVIIDAATLTGAMSIALGSFHTGYFTNDESLNKRVLKSLEHTEERAWRMPLDEEHRKLMKGIHADLKNIGGRKDAGSAQGAAFLSYFIKPGIPWAHFDIAGTAWNIGAVHTYCPAHGASGVMIRTFIDIARSY
jgi:leucyl aminopeptidase